MFRLVLVKLTKAGLLFDGKGSDELMTRWLWKSRQVTTVERFVQLVNAFYLNNHHSNCK